MQTRCIHLTGYFDRNFGDDMMMKLVVRSIPEITFLVDDTADTPLLSEPNVVQKDWEACCRFPKLVVIGSGFMINTGAALETELLWFLKGHHPGDYCLGCNMEPLPGSGFLSLAASKHTKTRDSLSAGYSVFASG